MMTYPGLVQLLRMLGRNAALEAIGAESEPDPDSLTAQQRAILSALIETHLETIAQQLADEAAASDDVGDSASAIQFAGDRIASFSDLMLPVQADRLNRLVADAVAGWG